MDPLLKILLNLLEIVMKIIKKKLIKVLNEVFLNILRIKWEFSEI